MRFYWSPTFLCVLCAATLRAEAPVAVYSFPAGGQRGKTVEFHVGGLFLGKSCKFEMLGPGVAAPNEIHSTRTPWFEGPVLPLPDSQRQEDYPKAMAARVTIAQDAALGNRAMRMWTSQGVSAPIFFEVGDLPELVEVETDDTAAVAVTSLPITINGRIFPREEVDSWGFSLKRGESITCSISARRFGSPLEAHLEIVDARGRKLAESSATAGDPRLHFCAPEDGQYAVNVRDVQYGGGPAFVYRLTLSNGPYVESVFPLGGQRGTRCTFKVKGPNLRSDTAEIAIPKDAGTEHIHHFEAAGRHSNPITLDVDNLPERLEDASGDPVKGNFLNVPMIGNGRITAPGQVDRWSFSARKGEAFEIEMRAARLGSPLLGTMTILDASGKELARVEAGGTGIDPYQRLTVPADGLYFVEVRDRFRSRGDDRFAYRLRIDRHATDFALQFAVGSLTIPRSGQGQLRVLVNRRAGYLGPIALHVTGLPDGVTIPKEPTVPAGQNQIDIPLKAAADARIASTSLNVRGTGWMQASPIASTMIPLSRIATWTSENADFPLDSVRVAVGLPTPFKITGEYSLKLVPRGTVYSRHYKIERNGFTGPIEVRMTDKQARHLQGVTGPTMTVAADQNEFDYPIELPPWMETGRTCRVCVMGTGIITEPDGAKHEVVFSSVEQNNQIIAVVEPERLNLSLDRHSVRVAPGETVAVSFRVARGKDLTGAARVELANIEQNSPIRAEAVTVEASADSGLLSIRLDRAAKPGSTRRITLKAVVEENKRPVTAEAYLEVVVAQ